jgi:polysaccharide biosynthesis protein PslG
MCRRVVVALFVLLCLPAAASARVPRDFFGVMANAALETPGVSLAAENRRMHQAGIGTERFEVAWDLVEPERGQYEFAATDRKVLDAARHGLDVLALVVRCPAWAARQPGTPFSPPRDPGDYAAFLRTLVARYGPKGSFWRGRSGPVRPVRAWQIWNEPNIVNYWSVQPFMRGYAALLDTAYAAVKRADRGATVVMAGMANFSWRDLNRLFVKGGRKLRFDVAAVHPFSGRAFYSVKIVRLNRAVLNRHHARRKPIWLTELTWSSAKGRKKPINKTWETTEAGQARRLTEAYTLYAKARRELRLQRIYWYTWATIDRNSKNSFDYSGLRTLRPDGRIVDKPAMRALRAIIRKLRR